MAVFVDMWTMRVFALEFKPSKKPGWPWMLWILNHALTRFEYWCFYYIQSCGGVLHSFTVCGPGVSALVLPSGLVLPRKWVFFSTDQFHQMLRFRLLGEVTVPIYIAKKFQLILFSNDSYSYLLKWCFMVHVYLDYVYS